MKGIHAPPSGGKRRLGSSVSRQGETVWSQGENRQTVFCSSQIFVPFRKKTGTGHAAFEQTQADRSLFSIFLFISFF